MHRVSANRKRERDKKKYHKLAPRRSAKHRNRDYDPRVLVNVRLRPKDIPFAQGLVLEQIMEHGGVTEACVNAGVGRATFYDWIQEPNFRKAYNRARATWRASVMPDVERAFVDRSQVRDTLAGIFLLKHNTKRYREVQRLELTGKDGGPMLTLDVKEELVRRLEKLAGSAKPEVRRVLAGSDVLEQRGPLAVLRAGSDDAGSQGLGHNLGVTGSGASGSRRGVRKMRGLDG